jgi:hypothetical protein
VLKPAIALIGFRRSAIALFLAEVIAEKLGMV